MHTIVRIQKLVLCSSVKIVLDQNRKSRQPNTCRICLLITISDAGMLSRIILICVQPTMHRPIFVRRISLGASMRLSTLDYPQGTYTAVCAVRMSINWCQLQPAQTCTSSSSIVTEFAQSKCVYARPRDASLNSQPNRLALREDLK